MHKLQISFDVEHSLKTPLIIMSGPSDFSHYPVQQRARLCSKPPSRVTVLFG